MARAHTPHHPNNDSVEVNESTMDSYSVSRCNEVCVVCGSTGVIELEQATR